MDYSQNLNQNIKLLLDAKNLSIRQLAEFIDIAASTLTDGLKSKKGIPIEHAIKIADYFGYSVESLSKKEFNELIAVSSLIIDDPESEIAKKIRSLNENGRIKLNIYLDDLLGNSANRMDAGIATDMMNTTEKVEQNFINQPVPTDKK